jgi:hypothetical protein
MRQSLDSLNQLNIKLDSISGNLYVPFSDKIFVYYSDNLEKLFEIKNEDDILNFHILNSAESNVVVVSKINKKISLFDYKGEKVKE